MRLTVRPLLGLLFAALVSFASPAAPAAAATPEVSTFDAALEPPLDTDTDREGPICIPFVGCF